MVEYALEIANLQKVYDNNVVALKGIDLKVKKGDFYALLGPNGAGKSSTIGIIGSLVTKTGGKVSVFGNDIDKDLNGAKSMLGVVSQEINFSQFEKVLDIVVTQAGFYGIPKSIAMPRVEDILKRLRETNNSFGYVLDLEDNLVGAVTELSLTQAITKDPDQGIEKAVVSKVETLHEDTSLRNLISVVSCSTYGVPVINQSNKYIGCITKTSLLNTLDQKLEKKNG